MSVLIGSARIDENGNATGGKAGDQKSGKEVSTQNWYLNNKGWRVFRAIDPVKRKMIAYAMQAACNNNNIGYDQNPNPSLFKVSKKYDYDPAKVTEKCETDCSKLVRVCCWYAGIHVEYFTTAYEGTALLNTGEFEEMKGDKYTNSSNYLIAGDILVTKTKGHTVVVLSNGPLANDGNNAFQFVLVTGNNVFVRKNAGKQALAIGLAHKGDRYSFLQKDTVITNPDGTVTKWYQIFYHDMVGWISSKYAILST